MFHEPHPGISGPAFLVVVADNVLVVGVRMLGEVTLDQVTGLFSREPEQSRKNPTLPTVNGGVTHSHMTITVDHMIVTQYSLLHTEHSSKTLHLVTGRVNSCYGLYKISS